MSCHLMSSHRKHLDETTFGAAHFVETQVVCGKYFVTKFHPQAENHALFRREKTFTTHFLTSTYGREGTESDLSGTAPHPVANFACFLRFPFGRGPMDSGGGSGGSSLGTRWAFCTASSMKRSWLRSSGWPG